MVCKFSFSFFVWLHCCCCCCLRLVRADWIDPDTPQNARTTQRLNARPPPKPQKDDKKDRKTKKPFDSPAPTVAPTAATPAPTPTPTSSPTSSPTFDPETFELVFSDEFNTPGRTFHDGRDPRWTALDKNDYTNDALHYYSPDQAVTNTQGKLVLTSQAHDTEIIGYDDVQRKKTHVTKHFRSAMLQTWNKFCFTGGILEAQVILPGQHNVGGLWPAFWLLGNLARHTYVGTSEHIWPWSSTTCALASMDAQKISGCDRIEHYGLHTHLGRGAPEIDVFEVQPGNIAANHGPFLQSPVGQPFMSSSFQVAPGRTVNRPGPGTWPGPQQWYQGLVPGNNTALNILFYGNYNHFLSDTKPEKQDYWSDAISMNRQLNADYFQKPHVYRLEWDVPHMDRTNKTNNRDGYLHWFLDGELVFSLDGKGLKQAGNGAAISSEPSYILLNTAISKQWGFPLKCPANCPCKNYDCHSKNWKDVCGFSEGFCDMMTQKSNPPQYQIDWVRVYQNPQDPLQKVGCSTPERPTRRYIEGHEHLYKTPLDVHPLQGIPSGDGVCDPQDGDLLQTCGGPARGRCTPGKVCECRAGWTGPHCLAHLGYDPVVYDRPDTIADVGFIPPKLLPSFAVVGMAVLVLFLLVTLQWRKRIKEGWMPIPDVRATRSF